ncbi:reverse transcriptase domain-containing protein [Verrucomicrobiales bacterium]|jgi:RNA-directed DNA polymerase|nr:reverse transcriptase domain-containing protein [Verrucomicrobiales bacterium]
MTAGYPEYVAVVLATLASNEVPPDVLSESRFPMHAQVKLMRHHLPQGAPSSPALANLCAFRLDCRLAGFARAAGAVYSRYADDLLFSGGEDFRRGARKFYIAVLAVIIDEGFKANLRKTRFMQSGQCQHAAGLVFNEKPNVRQAEFDQLKAILHNCVESGWQSQNLTKHPEFRIHLEGRVGWIAASNPDRGEKLRALFDRVKW